MAAVAPGEQFRRIWAIVASVNPGVGGDGSCRGIGPQIADKKTSVYEGARKVLMSSVGGIAIHH
jgi:hypothetical protein